MPERGPLRPLVLLSLSTALPIAFPSALAPQEPAPYGFAGHEIYKLAAGTAELAAGDLNGDGLGDLVVANPRRSRIELLLRLPEEAADWRDPGEADARVEYDGRFAIRHHPVERELEQLALADLDRDGLDDAAWVLAGGELHVLYGAPEEPGDGAEPRTARLRLEELRRGCAALEAADLDGDGREELLAAGKPWLLAVGQAAPGAELARLRVLDALGDGIDRLAHADLDGDGARDLVYLYEDAELPVRYRPGRPRGEFGLRIDFELPALREGALADLDGDGRAEVLAIFRDSGRLCVLEAAERAAGGAERSLERLALRPIEGRDQRRSFALGDLDGDGHDELLAAEPDVAKVQVLRSRDGAFEIDGYPNLVDVEQPRLGDLDGDGALELLTLSESERLLGIARTAPDGSLPFPETLPVSGTPHALGAADLDGDGADDVVLLSSTGAGRERRFQAEVLRGSPSGLAPAGEPSPLALKQPPSGLLVVDLDQDGARDLVLLEAGEDQAPVLALGGAGGFELDARGAPSAGLGILAGAKARSVSRGDLDGDGREELLAATKNFARALRFERDANGRLTPAVLAQFNGLAPDSAIGAALLVERSGAPPAEVALWDGRERELLVLERSGAEPAVLERAAAGALELEQLAAGDLDGDGRTDLVLFSADELAVLPGGAPEGRGRKAELVPQASYDPAREKTYLDTLAVGDLNSDDRPDVLAVEGFEHLLQIFSAEDGLARRLEFPVFEQGALEEARASEPRELCCTDLDGDGAADVAALVHDKLIVYLQDRTP